MRSKIGPALTKMHDYSFPGSIYPVNNSIVQVRNQLLIGFIPHALGPSPTQHALL